MPLSFITKITKINAILLAILVCGLISLIYSAPAYAATPTDKEISEKLSKNPIVKDLNTIVNFLSAGVGIIVVIVIIIGGIQYAMAGDNAQAVSAAKQRIINGLIAILAFLFMFAFLQWLIPGGVFNK